MNEKSSSFIFLSSVTLSGRTLYISLTLHYCVCIFVFLLCLASLAEGEEPEAPPPLLPHAVSKILLQEAGPSLPNTYLRVVSTGCFDISCRNKSQPSLLFILFYFWSSQSWSPTTLPTSRKSSDHLRTKGIYLSCPDACSPALTSSLVRGQNLSIQ